MMIKFLFKMFKSFFFFIVSLFKRALCCFRRRKRTTEFVPLTQVGVIADQSTVPIEAENWSDWNDQTIPNSKPNSIQEQIEYYRQQAIAARQVKDELPEAQEDFFNDMAPTITKQTKVLINDTNEDNSFTNKLSLTPESVNVMSQELEEWEDHTGWDDPTLDFDAREALKESRKQARQKKVWEQQLRRQERHPRMGLGAKVYS